MKTVIVALNSKYIHSALAPWYLKANCPPGCGEIKVLEFSINDLTDNVLARIYEENCDVVAFSCYIWNIEEVLKLADNLKKVNPQIKIIVGGPEVSFNANDIMEKYQFIDYIISGEGETAFRRLISSFANEDVDIGSIENVTYRKGEGIAQGESYGIIEDLNLINSPYSDEMLAATGGKIVYYESSRGCPFNCSYCLSSTFKGVRYLSMDRVKSDILSFIKAGVKLVKFVDRTFNCNLDRAKEIISFINENAARTHFHFEAAADLFDEEMLDILKKTPAGLIQFEIGIQTTNNKALEAVNRKTRLDKVFSNIVKLNSLGNVHLHLDLIVGLPYEDYNSFKKSFNEVCELEPQQLQVGFLKLLKGSSIRANKDKYGYKFRDYPPYEILSSDYLSYGEIIKLKNIEDMVERFMNSGRFDKTLKMLIKSSFCSPFDFYEKLSSYFKDSGYFQRNLSSRDMYTALLGFVKSMELDLDEKAVMELMKFDFLHSNNTNNLPEGITRNMEVGFKEKCFEFLKSEDNIKNFIPEFEGIPAKQIYSKVHFEIFSFDVTKNHIGESEKTVVLFDYTTSNPVTGYYYFTKVPIDT